MDRRDIKKFLSSLCCSPFD